jgi:adenylate kinase
MGLLAKSFMDKGQLVPDDVIIGVVLARMNEDDCMLNGWLLDGFPRTAAQAVALLEAGLKCDKFIFLDVPDSALVERVVGRRSDPVTGKIYHVVSKSCININKIVKHIFLFVAEIFSTGKPRDSCKTYSTK